MNPFSYGLDDSLLPRDLAANLYPVCDSRGQVFYSPCHAGCRNVFETREPSFKLVNQN